MTSWRRALLFFKGPWLLGGLLLVILWQVGAWADLTFNVLAVNGTDKEKDKEIEFYLPQELRSADILDTADMVAEYDVNVGAYKVKGNVKLGPKESKTIKIRIKDVWVIDKEQVDSLKGQIDMGLESIKDTEFFATGEVKRDALVERLDYIVEEQERYADNIEQRIDRYRIYARELEQIREKAQSIKYWRALPGEEVEEDIFKLVLYAENPSPDHAVTREQKYYLPPEVKPEHIVNAEGFDVRFDMEAGQAYLSKTDELAPGEVKRYEVGIKDIWNIQQTDLENLKDRTRVAFKAVEKSKYAANAKVLVDEIKQKLESIELSQEIDREIKEHISVHRDNMQTYESALKDVAALEQLLEAVQENLERSILKNVLQKIKQLKSIMDIAKAIFKKRPKLDKILKIIISVIAFVAFLTTVHFIIWGRRSREAKLREFKENEGNEPGNKKE